jgi:hypothetical protein
MKVTANKEQKLYVIPCGDDGFTCLGFQVCLDRATALALEMWQPVPPAKKGTIKLYNEYRKLVAIAAGKNRDTGWRSKTELHPQLIGLEEHRVEVEDQDGEVYRFLVGKSTGWIPCHLQLCNVRSSGGGCVDSRPFKRVTVIKYP